MDVSAIVFCGICFILLIFFNRGMRAKRKGQIEYQVVVSRLSDRIRTFLGLEEGDELHTTPFFSDAGDHYLIAKIRDRNVIVIASDDWMESFPINERRKCEEQISYDASGEKFSEVKVLVESESLKEPLVIYFSRRNHKKKGFFGKAIMESVSDFKKLVGTN